jgi:hypothetical protein
MLAGNWRTERLFGDSIPLRVDRLPAAVAIQLSAMLELAGLAEV